MKKIVGIIIGLIGLVLLIIIPNIRIGLAPGEIRGLNPAERTVLLSVSFACIFGGILLWKIGKKVGR